MPGASNAPDEFELIGRFFRGLDQGPDVALGNGDDAAVLNLRSGEQLAVSVDTMLDGVHFPRNSPPRSLAYRAVAAAASDLAAMGARPLAMTLALTLPEPDEVWLRGCREGLARAAADFSLPLIGGDLTRGPLTVTVQVLGAVDTDQALRRDGARPGDVVFVAGPLGDAAAGLAVIQDRIHPPADLADELRRCFWYPQPQLALGMQLRGLASAAIDISDGLLADLQHLANASGVRISIEAEAVPLSNTLQSVVAPEQARAWALGGGEDYRLCFTLPQDVSAPAGCTAVGRVESGQGVLCDAQVNLAGYRHF